MDTDSFIYSVFTDDFYSDIESDLIKRFYRCDNDPNNPFGLLLVNKKEVGLMKDEACG